MVRKEERGPALSGQEGLRRAGGEAGRGQPPRFHERQTDDLVKNRLHCNDGFLEYDHVQIEIITKKLRRRRELLVSQRDQDRNQEELTSPTLENCFSSKRASAESTWS
jgi:hypothetical protein